MSSRALWLCILLLVGSGMAADIPYVFDESSTGLAGYSADQLMKISASSPDLTGVPPVSTPADNTVLDFPVVGGGNSSKGKTERKVADLKAIFNARVEPDNLEVRHEAVVLAGKYPEDHTIEQIGIIYSYLKNGDSSTRKWSYVDDPRGKDLFSYANQSLKWGMEIGCTGVGNCDDFAILMSALVESAGGATRIILAHNNSTGGHAYTEVYLGQLNSTNDRVEEILSWLKDKYDTDKIYTYIDTITKDVWLNLDWSADHPGGPLYKSDKCIVLCIRDNYAKYPLNLPEKPNKSPRITGFVADKPSPQDVGAVITWTAEAKDPDKDQVLYCFFLNDDPVTRWVKDNTWIWNTTEEDVGDNRIEVRVIDEKHAGPDGFDSRKVANFTVTKPKPAEENQLPVINDLVADKSSPQDAGTAITWTTEAKDPDNDQILYRFFLNDEPMTKWTTDNKWVWNTTDVDLGRNQIEARIKDGKHADQDSFDSNRTAGFTITEPRPVHQALSNQIPVIESLALDKSSPQEAGTSITWTASAYDPENDPLLYRFLLNGRPATDWINDNVWHWNTSEKYVGDNQVDVQIRDGKHAGAKACDDSAAANFMIVRPNQPPALTKFGASSASPQPPGTMVRWMALATDPDGDALYYRYGLKGPSTNNALIIVRDWSSDNTWIWTTCPVDTGQSQILVWVRDNHHVGTNEWNDQADAYFTVQSVNKLPTVAALNPDRSSPQDVGTEVIWTALASDPDGDPILYRFMLNGKPATDWTRDNTWAWKTTEDEGGENKVEVRVRDGMHASSDDFDDDASASFTINKVEAHSGVVALGGHTTPTYVPGPAVSHPTPTYRPGPSAYPIGSSM